MVEQRSLLAAGVRAAIIGGFWLLCPGLASALCASPDEGGRWWNVNPAGDPISVEVTLDSCGDQVLNGQQTETRYGVKVFVKQSNGNLYQRPKVSATYRTSNGNQWLFAKVPTGGYVDHVWLRTEVRNGEKRLYAYIKHESLDSKPSAESKLWFARQRPAEQAQGVPSQATRPPLGKKYSSAAQVAVRSAATCKTGYVWREARPSDLVCVAPESRALIATENQNAAQGVQPGAAPYCRSGLVWREAFSGDTVCVSPLRRDQVRQENQAGPTLLAQR